MTVYFLLFKQNLMYHLLQAQIIVDSFIISKMKTAVTRRYINDVISCTLNKFLNAEDIYYLMQGTAHQQKLNLLSPDNGRMLMEEMLTFHSL